MVEGLGLTTAELMLARTTAIRYAGKRDKPARLVDLMARFGLDFLTITPLSRENIQGLRSSSSAHWNELLTSAPQEDSGESESSSDESAELSVSWDTRDETGDFMPGPDVSGHEKAVRTHIANMLLLYVSRSSETTEEREQEVAAAERRPSGSSGLHRRKRTVPRRVVAPSTSQASSSTSSRQEPQVASQAQQGESQEVSTVSPRDTLLAFPGIAGTRIPNEASLNRLQQFLQENQPCSVQNQVRVRHDILKFEQAVLKSTCQF